MSAGWIAPSRRGLFVALAVLNAVGLLLVARFVHGELNEWGGDNVDFLLLARALAAGEGYVDLHVVGHPPHTQYPPLFPALLAPLVYAGASLVACKWLVASCSLAGLNLALVLLARSHGLLRATLACLATACSAVFLDPALSVMSDGPYLLLSLAALLACGRALGLRNAGAGAHFGSCVAAGALVGLSILTRTVGVALIPALAAAALFGESELALRVRLRRAAAMLLAASALAAPWFLWATRAEGTGRGYVEQLLTAPDSAAPDKPALPAAERGQLPGARPQSGTTGAPAKALAPDPFTGPAEGTRTDGSSGSQRMHETYVPTEAARTLLGRPLHNARDLWLRLYYVRAPRWFQSRGLGREFRVALLALVLGLAGLGVAGLARGILVRRALYDDYVALYLLVLTLWVGGGPRLLVPVLPFLIVYVADGAGWLASLVKRLRPARAGLELAALTLALLLSAGVTFFSPRLRGRLTGEHPDWWLGLQEASRFLGEKGEPGLLVLTQPASVPYYVAGLQSPAARPGMETTDRLRRQIMESGADYVILTRPYNLRTDKHLARVLRSFPDEFAEVRVFHDVRLYRLRWKNIEERWGLRR